MVFGRASPSRSESSATQQDLARYGRRANSYVAFVARTLLRVDVCNEFVAATCMVSTQHDESG